MATPTDHTVLAFEEYLARMGSSPHTVRAYGSDVRGFLKFAGQVQPADIESKAATYLTGNREKWSPRTLSRKKAAIIRFAKISGVPDILADYKAPTPERLKAHPLPEGMAGVVAMLHRADTRRHQALVALCGLCGLRIEEARGVLAEHVDLEAGSIKVLGKGSKYRTVFISSEAMKWIEPAVETALALEEPLCGEITDRAARQYITNLGIRTLGHAVASHDLRMTVVTAVYNKNKDIRAAQEFAGHASVEVTQGYIGVSEDTARESVEVV